MEVRNGINYSGFLEGIIRTAYYRLDDQGLQDQDGALKNILEDMFNDGNIELKKRMMEDRLISELYSHDNCKVFYQHHLLLTSIFEQKATYQREQFQEMSKEAFITMLVESGVLNEKQAEEVTGPLKLKFNAEGIVAAIHNTGSFDENFLTYVDFLDALVRVAFIYPYTEQERAQMPAMDQKLNFIIDRLNEKYGGWVSTFIEIVAKRIEDGGYQPRQVVDDEEIEDAYDDS
jgi:hypothetical protein